MSLNGRAYRGQMVALRSTTDRLNVVNYVDIESYIEGVLAGEVPSSWPEESLKAQAVAARSYVLYQVEHHRRSRLGRRRHRQGRGVRRHFR